MIRNLIKNIALETARNDLNLISKKTSINVCAIFSSNAPSNKNKDRYNSDKDIKSETTIESSKPIELSKHGNNDLDSNHKEKNHIDSSPVYHDTIRPKQVYDKVKEIIPDPEIRYNKYYEDPIERAAHSFKSDILEFFRKFKNPVAAFRKGANIAHTAVTSKKEIFPSHCDIVIIGGGIVGTSIAFHLQERGEDGLNVVVIEKDMTYSKASTVLSVGGIRQQFSLPENIELSMYGLQFLQHSKERLRVKGCEPPNVDFTFGGYLTLASEEGLPQLLENFELQRNNYAYVVLYTKKQLKNNFPWINTEGIEAGVFGTQREGWFDPWSFLLAMKSKSIELGTEFVNGTVTNSFVESLGERQSLEGTMLNVKSVEVTLPDGEKRNIHCSIAIIASGCWSKEVGLKFGIGNATEGFNTVPIPVEPRKRYVYCVHSPNGPGLLCPLVINPNGTYFRREGLADLYVCGRAPESEEEEPSTEDLSVDSEYFLEKVWPTMAHRCPSFENLKVHSEWAGYYDYNTFDQNAILGCHPAFRNLYIATGFSGHGIQQAAGAGKAIADLILGAKKPLDVSRFAFERILCNLPYREKSCY